MSTAGLPSPPQGRPLVFAGPGVLAQAAVADLRRFAEHCNVGVANSFRAKGVFRWDDPHHYGTIGLQRDDFVLAGFASAPAIVAVGVDESETPRERWALAPVVDLAVGLLGRAADEWPRWDGGLAPPELYHRLASVVQPLYASDAVPLAPPRAIANGSAALGEGDRVLAMPGVAGFWVARAFPTTSPGSIVVARERRVVAEPPIRLAITDGDPAAIEGDVVVEVWGEAADVATAAEHADAVREAIAGGRRTVIRVPVDLGTTQLLEELAGPLIPFG